jgi:HK97 family phage prohead protease
MVIEYKSHSFELKDFDEKTRTVKFLASKYDVVDAHNDIVVKEAFSDINVNRLKHFLNHNKNIAIGKVKEIDNTNEGLFIVSTISKARDGEDAYLKYQEGIITEHSTGTITKKSHKNEQGQNVITKSELWEVSSLTHWGANEHAQTISVKAVSDFDLKIKELQDKIEMLEIALKDKNEQEKSTSVFKQISELVNKTKLI